MEFDFRAKSTDTLKPIHYFDGDEMIDSDTYERCMTGGYMSTVSFGMGAAKSLGMQIDTETLERWKRICNAAYLIDDYVDNEPDTTIACDLYDASMERALELTNDQILDKANLPPGADELMLPAIVLMKNSVSNLPERRLASLKNAATEIGVIARQKQTCDQTDKYVSLLKDEAYFTSRLITESVSDDVREQPEYRQFTVWCIQLMEMAILGDSTIDMRDDSKQHVMNIEPTMRNMAKLALQAFGSSRKIVRDAPQRKATIASLIERSKFYRS